MPLSHAMIAVVAVTAPAPAEALPLTATGTIAVVRPAPVDRRPSPTLVFAEAVEEALIDAGFTAIPHAAHARHVATIDVQRTGHGAALAKGANGTGAMPMLGAGGGGGVSIGLGSKTNVGQMVATELTLRITRRGESTPAWEGRAITYQVTGTRADDPAALARKLSGAIMRNFGGPSGLLVSVP